MGFIYILANRHRNVLYVGSTSNLYGRLVQHKKKLITGFSSRYNVDQLVYYEKYDIIDEAVTREKQIKGYNRAKKEHLIAALNPCWRSTEILLEN